MFSKIFLSLFLTLPLFISASNPVNDNDLMGVWEVRSVSLIDSNSNSRSGIPKEHYESAQFHFKGNSRYSFSYGPNTPEQIKASIKSYNNWMLKGETIKIGHILNGYAFKHIKIEVEDDQVYFLTSNFKLKVEKISKEEPFESERSDFVNIWLKYLMVSDNGNLNRSIDESNTYTIDEVDQLPLYKRCKSKWEKDKQMQCLSEYLSKFLYENLNTRKIAKESDRFGEVVRFEVCFIIDTEGNPANIHVLGGTNFAIKEVLKTIEKLKEAQPAVIDYKAVNIVINLPVRFSVQK